MDGGALDTGHREAGLFKLAGVSLVSTGGPPRVTPRTFVAVVAGLYRQRAGSPPLLRYRFKKAS